MVALRFDSTGSLALRWPSTYRAVVALGEAYIAYEGSLSPEAQLKDISLMMIEAALAEAKAAIAAAQKGEQTRASAGEVTMRKGMTKCEVEVRYRQDYHWNFEGRIAMKLEVLPPYQNTTVLGELNTTTVVVLNDDNFPECEDWTPQPSGRLSLAHHAITI